MGELNGGEYIDEFASPELEELIPRTRDEAAERLGEGKLFRLLDSIVKYLLARPENSSICLDFLNAVVFPENNRVFERIEIMGDKLPARLRGRGSRIDLRGELDDGSKVNVEIQVNYDSEHSSRAVYYWSLVHTNRLEFGDVHQDTGRTISVNILGFDMLKFEKNFRNSYSIRNDGSSRVLTDDLKIIFIELPKYIRELKKPGRKLMNKLERWLCFFVGFEEEIMPNIAEVEPAIGEALLQERVFVMDERLRMAYIDDLMDIYSELRREARRQKLEEERRNLAGEREILIERERKAIIRLFEMGMPIIDISRTVGITEKEVRNFIA